jgi:hypothetical protein
VEPTSTTASARSEYQIHQQLVFNQLKVGFCGPDALFSSQPKVGNTEPILERRSQIAGKRIIPLQNEAIRTSSLKSNLAALKWWLL